jgi:TorA maturation chaperone TorD
MRDCVKELALLTPDLRSAIYEAFATAYTTVPTSNSLAQLGELGSKLAVQFGEGSYAALAAVTAERYQNKLDSSLEEITQEYYDLFFVPSSARYVPPFESAIISKVLWGRETVHCAECYKTVGFDPFDLDIFPPLKEQRVPDHIGLQLAFTAFLARMGAECEDEAAASSWRNLELQFLQEHLMNWVPGYTKAVEKCGESFYVALTVALTDFLAMAVAALEYIQRNGAN